MEPGFRQTEAGSAIYLLAQHRRNPIRREGRNIGVFVLKNGEAAAKFVAESAPGKLDLRKSKQLPYPRIYKRWVASWRERLVKTSFDCIQDKLLADSLGNYVVIPGGELSDTGDDSPTKICEFLFAALVEEPVLSRDVDDSDGSDSPTAPLKREITKEFKQLSIMGVLSSDAVPHPILENTPLTGGITTHTPSYFQSNGDDWVMEPVNFGTSSKSQARDHACYAASMFADLIEKRRNIKAIAIVQATDEDLADDRIAKILPLLKARATGGLLYWNDERQRKQFLAERVRIARGSHR